MVGQIGGKLVGSSTVATVGTNNVGRIGWQSTTALEEPTLPLGWREFVCNHGLVGGGYRVVNDLLASGGDLLVHFVVDGLNPVVLHKFIPSIV